MTAAFQSGPDWRRLHPRDEEFSILTPVQPSIFIPSAGDTFADGGEKVLEQRAYSAYSDGCIFVVESFRASRPQRLAKEMTHVFEGLQPLENVTVNGFAGTKYRTNRSGFVYSFITAKHVYVFTVASRNMNHPTMTRFVSSFQLGDNSTSKDDITPERENDSVTAGLYQTSVMTPKDVSLKAILIWKPDPAYTDEARIGQTKGVVILQAVFTESGKVVISEVIKGLRAGLTQKAIEAAKNIKFLPAEKDGRAVPLRIRLEYNFNLY